jgi:hypothetical protein
MDVRIDRNRQRSQIVDVSCTSGVHEHAHPHRSDLGSAQERKKSDTLIALLHYCQQMSSVAITLHNCRLNGNNRRRRTTVCKRNADSVPSIGVGTMALRNPILLEERRYLSAIAGNFGRIKYPLRSLVQKDLCRALPKGS